MGIYQSMDSEFLSGSSVVQTPVCYWTLLCYSLRIFDSMFVYVTPRTLFRMLEALVPASVLFQTETSPVSMNASLLIHLLF